MNPYRFLLPLAVICWMRAGPCQAQAEPIDRDRGKKKQFEFGETGKTLRVYWDPYSGGQSSIYILFPPSQKGQPPLQRAHLQVWLLKDSGNAIPPKEIDLNAPVISNSSANIPLATRYTYEGPAAWEAVALTIKIDGEFFVKRLIDPE